MRRLRGIGLTFGRILRYGFVGGAVSLIFSLVIILFVAVFHVRNATVASVYTFALLLPLSYAAHRYVTFFDAEHDAFQPLRFTLTTASSFVVMTAGMYVITSILGWSYLFGIALNWLVIPAMNFILYLVWVFHPARPAAQETGQER